MKKISKIILLSALLTTTIWSCKKDENKIYFTGGTAPVLSANKTAINLSFVNKNQEAIKLLWTNPNYKFTTGLSSQTVAYVIEIDTTGANFTNPNKKSISLSSDLSISFTQGDFNDFLLNQLVLKPGIPHNIEIRVTSTLNPNSVPLTSNVLKYTVIPYAIPPKVAPPASGKLYITGSATPASWQCGCNEPELLTQKFTQVSPTLYVLPSIALTGGGSYLLLPVYGSWSAKYGGTAANNKNDVNGDDFKDGGNDLLAPSVSGNYKIEVDFQRGKFTVTKL